MTSTAVLSMYRHTEPLELDTRCSCCIHDFKPNEEVVTHDGKQFLHKECFDNYAKFTGFGVAICMSGCGRLVDYASLLTEEQKLSLRVKTFSKYFIPIALTALLSLSMRAITTYTEGNFALATESLGTVGMIALIRRKMGAFIFLLIDTSGAPDWGKQAL